MPGGYVLRFHQSLCYHRKTDARRPAPEPAVSPLPARNGPSCRRTADSGQRRPRRLFFVSLGRPQLRAHGSGAASARGGEHDRLVHDGRPNLPGKLLPEHLGPAAKVAGWASELLGALPEPTKSGLTSGGVAYGFEGASSRLTKC